MTISEKNVFFLLPPSFSKAISNIFYFVLMTFQIRNIVFCEAINTRVNIFLFNKHAKFTGLQLPLTFVLRFSVVLVCINLLTQLKMLT